MIISTTYGPQKDGKFYQRFGPLARAGGGRRLNVLVTRARQEVHVVTSIPAELYRVLPPVPAGETAGGAWLLYAYLQFAERLGEAYAGVQSGDGEVAAAVVPGRVVRQEQQRSLPSRFAESLARELAARHGMGSTVHWGNDGFCVDVALTHPVRAEEVTIGVLCDSARFRNAEDPVEWDLFRTMVHESQGWKLERVWTPQFFRRAGEVMEGVAKNAREFVMQEKPPDALGVERTS